MITSTNNNEESVNEIVVSSATGIWPSVVDKRRILGSKTQHAQLPTKWLKQRYYYEHSVESENLQNIYSWKET